MTFQINPDMIRTMQSEDPLQARIRAGYEEVLFKAKAVGWSPSPPASLRKACACEYATASGPRVITKYNRDEYGEADTATLTLVSMACDRCNTPWEVVKS